METDSAVYGSLYQWGRVSDGHQRRDSPNSLAAGPAPGTYTGFGVAWEQGGSEQIRSDSTRYYGKFITSGSYSTGNGAYAPYDWNRNPTSRNLWLWPNYQNDPCAHVTGVDGGSSIWHIPTESEWGEIFKGSKAAGAPGTAKANTWTWRNPTPASPSDGDATIAGGYEIKPDGVTITLFLPAAGSRADGNGQLYWPGVNGSYWSATAYSDFSFDLSFSSDGVGPGSNITRAYALSVRCIAEI